MIASFAIDHPSGHKTILRNWRIRSAYRAGYEDWQYDQSNDNPYLPSDPRWQKYEHGNQDARRQHK